LQKREAISDVALAHMMTNAGYPVSGSFINYLKHGRRIPAPELVEVLADVLMVDLKTRTNLHRAACMDYGYMIGVTYDQYTGLYTPDDNARASRASQSTYR